MKAFRNNSGLFGGTHTCIYFNLPYGWKQRKIQMTVYQSFEAGASALLQGF